MADLLGAFGYRAHEERRIGSRPESNENGEGKAKDSDEEKEEIWTCIDLWPVTGRRYSR